MAVSYQTLMNTYLGDGARTTKYDVKIIIPFMYSNGSNTVHADDFRALSVLCKTSSFPSRTVNSQDYMFRGHNIPIPINTQYEQQWQCSFYNDEHHAIRSIFEEWMEAVETRAGDYKTFRGSRTYNLPNNQLVVNGDGIFIEQYKFTDNIEPVMALKPTVRYRLYGVFPTNIQSVEVNSEQESIETFTVDFKYTYYDVEYLRQ